MEYMLRLAGCAALHAVVLHVLYSLMGDAGAQLAIAPLIGGALIMGGAGLGSSLINKFGGGDSVGQVPLETEEQAMARHNLNRFANTGQWGDFKVGAEVPLGYGDFRASGQELAGLSALQDLLASPQYAMYDTGDAALQDFLQTSPQAIEAQFQPFREQTERQVRESNRALKREAGFAGNLYSTDTIRRLGDVQARGNETLASKMAALVDSERSRRLQALPLAYQSAEGRQNMALARVAASQQFGGLVRQLNDASIKARDQELLRRRQELQLPIRALESVASMNSNFGVPSVEAPSPYAGMLQGIGNIGGQYLSNALFFSQLKNTFGPGSPTASVYSGPVTGTVEPGGGVMAWPGR